MGEQTALQSRREFLKRTLAMGAAGGMASTVLARQVFAMGSIGQLPEGIRKVQGSVQVNGAPAAVGSIVFPGDVITTGSASLGVFVLGKDAFLVRENSRIELSGDPAGQKPGATKIATSIKVVAGKLLSVFGSGAKRIETTTAVAGTRGTGVFVEMISDVTYLCLCYGKADIDAKAYPGERESISTRHHEEPYYILPAGMKQAFLKAPMLDHTDEELIMLEALTGRVPPFGSSPSASTGGY